ncbi:MAG: DUF5703 family protein [Actinomycetota bacterium]|nr:DUF5703 family protein [Actinomycetota bacterium]MDA3025902.1 DUF5703 family protein [Actinomycetota bacterium]
MYSSWEIREVPLPSSVSRVEARELLTELAEYGRWELVRTRIYPNGVKRMWVKKRIQKVERT